MSVDNSAIVTAFGAYYMNEGQNMARLRSAIREKSVTPSFATPKITENDLYRSANADLSEIVQGFQTAWTPKGILTFTPNEIPLRNIKIDKEIFPDKLKESWLGFLTSVNENERKAWPIERYLSEEHIAKRIPHDLETKAYFKGSYVAPTPGTATSASEVMDGIKTIITAGLLGNMHTVTLTDAITASNAFDRVEEFVDGLSELTDKGVQVTVKMPKKILKWYLRDKRNTHGQDVNYDGDSITVDFTDVQLVGLPSMAGENMIWATPKDNFIYLRKRKGMNNPKVEESKRQLFFMTDWWEAIGFDYDELVYAATWV
jgi:hypothetical protein